jgi:DNA-nicking Smr family endonuclease
MQTTDHKKENFGDILARWEKTPEAKKAEAQIKKEKESQAPAPRRSVNYEKISADATIDLHGLTVAEAQAQLRSFFIEAHRNGWKKVLIIHGKGIHSKDEPKLKKAVMDFIEHSSYAGKHGKPGAADGGSGAVWVAIKN